MKYTPEMTKIEISQVADCLKGKPQLCIEQAEQCYRQELLHVCDIAIEQQKSIILITGPSASGKTTTAKRLADAFMARGKKVNRISLDNFYFPTSRLPLWEDGYQNYESIEGLDIPCFDHVVNELLTNKTADFPIFDFTCGKRAEKTYSLSYDENTTLIIEGIHALNPRLYNTLSQYPAMKIYISVHSDFYQNGELLLTARDLRLSRRLLRDYHYRSTSGAGTLNMWNYVIKGEDLYIRPFRQYADIHIDSTHAYEPFLYHEGLTAMLDEIASDSPYYSTARHLLDANEALFGIPYDLIPSSSLIQEFIKSNYLNEHKITTR